MHSSLLALAASLSVAAAVNRGFNYGAVTRDGAIKNEDSFTSEFKAAKGLANTDGAFSSARLYTMIQSGTTNSPISAIPAAISTDTKLFLGMWASSGQTTIDNEIAALKSAISQYGSDFTSRVNGISVGSEDLYRISPTGLANDPLSVGAQPSEIVSYIKQVKSAISGTALNSVPVGHVDTWDVWRNGSNADVIAASDFLGMNTFPYFQTTQNNDITNAPTLFNDAYDITVAAANGKPVLVTETGWPVSGKNSASAVPSTENARSYYEAVGCNTLFGKVDTYWYTLVDANTDTASQPQFGVVGTTVSTTPLFDLSCDATNTTSTSSSASGSSTAAATSTKNSVASASGTATGVLSILPISTSSGSVSSASLAPEAGRPDSTSVLAGGNQTVPAATGGVTSTGTSSSSTPTSTVANAAGQMKAGVFVALFGPIAALFVLV